MAAKNTTLWTMIPALTASALIFVAQTASAQTVAANNVNSPTSAAAKADASDLDLMKRIRDNVMADKSLSSSARNVKVLALHGNVTLNGMARDEKERNAIEMKAISVVGIDRVVDDIQIAGAK